ncbi:MAG: hypothetical protein ACQSGP_14620 [Frankia sp.]
MSDNGDDGRASGRRGQAGRRKQGAWQRFRSWLAGPRSQLPLPRQRWVPTTPSTSFLTPSKGDAYDFSVEVKWAWTGGADDVAALEEEVEPYREDTWDKIAVAIRCILRCYPPHQAAEAEAAINRRLADLALDDQADGTAARWAARVEVSLHEDVRSIQQAAWARRLRRAADHELAGTLVDNHIEMAHRWRRLLAEIGIGEATDAPPPPFVGRYLLRLAAEPAEAPNVVDVLSHQRELKDRELLDTVFKAVTSADNVNLLEFEATYDSALRRLMAWAGLPLPEIAGPAFNENGSW